jgi:hypothetical protein
MEMRQLLAENAYVNFESLLKHLLVEFDDVPKALLMAFAPVYGTTPAQHWARAESPFLSARTWAMSRRFARTLVEVRPVKGAETDAPSGCWWLTGAGEGSRWVGEGPRPKR